jgi:hypothetical protein
MINLSNRAIAAALLKLLDEIAAAAKATSHGRISGRLIGRVLACELGISVWEAQTVAKAWQAARRKVGLERRTGTLVEEGLAYDCRPPIR